MPLIETHCIDWTCRKCKTTARLPQLHDATIAAIRGAIVRGHERRDFDCHMKHGVKHILAVQDGKTLRFGADPSSPAEASDTPAAENRI